MTQPSHAPADAIRGLIEERDRYQSWIDAIEGRRDATPPHVFERVYTDYAARLHGARSRLAEHTEPLRTTEAALARRQDDVVRRLAEGQDELAELELRTLVGEFGPDDGEQRVQQAASVVRELDADRRSVAGELDVVRGLLQQIGSGQPADAAPPSAPAAAAEAPAIETATQPGPSAETATPAQSEEAPAAPAAPAPSGASVSQPVSDDTFVGTGARLDSLAAALGAASTPQPVASGQERTLRCQDCGEMNYPTEWYCERCGGELAAL